MNELLELTPGDPPNDALAPKITLTICAAPPSANRIWRTNRLTGRTYLNPEYKTYKDLVAVRVFETRAGIPDDWEFCDVEIIVRPKRRVGDVDNRIKPVLDALTHAGFWYDDKIVASVRASFGEPSKDGETVVICRKRTTKFGGESARRRL